jgi:hypothetical protein
MRKSESVNAAADSSFLSCRRGRVRRPTRRSGCDCAGGAWRGCCVGLDGADRYERRRCDLVVGAALGHELDDLEFSLGQLCCCPVPSSVGLHEFGEEAGRGPWRHESASVGDGPNGVGEKLRHLVLDEESSGASTRRAEDVLVEVKRGDDEHASVGALKHPGCFHAIHEGHANVHDNDVGHEPSSRVNRSWAIWRKADNVDVRFEQQEVAEVVADPFVVVGDHDANSSCAVHEPIPIGRVARTCQPPLVDGPMSSCPPHAAARSRMPTSPWPPSFSSGDVAGGAPSSSTVSTTWWASEERRNHALPGPRWRRTLVSASWVMRRMASSTSRRSVGVPA